MELRDIFIFTRGTKVVLSITFLVSFTAVLFAIIYYTGLNRAEDPRIRRAQELLVHYDNSSSQYDLAGKLGLLDSIEAIFKALPDYTNSFETGVILNNRASALLIEAIYDTLLPRSEKFILLDLAMIYCDSSIKVYRSWIKEWEHIDRTEIENRLRMSIDPGNPAFKGRNFDRIISRRVDNIVTARTETPRRLSVSLSNRGIIFRHEMNPDSALVCFNQALDLWEHNREAKSNLSVLMGGDPLKAGLIEALFPPDRNKK